MYRLLISVAAAAVLLSTVGAPRAGVHEYVEDFTSSQYKDGISTTALWDLASGELKLPPITLGITGGLDTPGLTSGVKVAGDYAYIADGSSGIRVIDITDPANPFLAGKLNFPTSVREIDISGDFLYVVAYNKGLKVVDISDPTTPVQVGSETFYGLTYDVIVRGDIAYVASYAGGLYTLDVSDPTDPVVLGNYNTCEKAYDLAVAGDYVYVANTTAGTGLYVIDASDPSNLTQVALFVTPGIAYGVAVSGNHAFVADYTAGMCVADITDPTNPTFAASYDTPGLAFDITTSGDYAYVADWYGGLHAVDVSDPLNPSPVGELDTPGDANGVVVDGDYAYVTNFTEGLQVVKIGVPVQPEILGSHDTPGLAAGVKISGNYAYVADGSPGVRVFDVTDPLNPTHVGSYNTNGSAREIDVAGDYLYVSDYDSGLKVADISDPANPVQIGVGSVYGLSYDVVVEGDIAYMASYAGGLYTFDVSDPLNPQDVGNYNVSEKAYDLAVSGDFVYVANTTAGTGLYVIDASDPSNLTQAALFNTPGFAYGVAVAGNYAYVADYTSGLCVVDISDPTNPAFAASYDTPGLAFDVALAGNYAYVFDWYGGIQVIDIHDPLNPVLYGSMDTPGDASSGVVSGDYLYVTDFSAGLHVVKVFEGRFTTENNFAQSLVLDELDDLMRKVRISANQVGDIDWEFSADGGGSWEMVTMDGTWKDLVVPGSDVQWRAVLRPDGGPQNPTVTDLNIEWLYRFASVDAINDVPDDQGGWLRLHFSRSDLDFVSEPAFPIMAYNIHRRVDDPVFVSSVLTRGELVVSSTRVSRPSGDDLRILPLPPEKGSVLKMGERYYVMNEGFESTAPPGLWEVVGTVFAQQTDDYIALVPTTGDMSPSGTPYSVYYVSAHTTTPSVFYTSPPDSGYSEDNIPPGAPGSLNVAYVTGSGNRLTWSPPSDNDLDFYRIYRDSDPNFEPSPANRVSETASSEWSDPDFDGWNVHYKVSGVDDAGNEGAVTTAGTATGIADADLPHRFGLYQNSPNPFNPTTKIVYDVPAGGGNVRIDVFDVSGRRVRTLLNRYQPPGSRSVTWDGRNENGYGVASGVYFYRLTAPGFTKTLKMTLLQ